MDVLLKVKYFLCVKLILKNSVVNYANQQLKTSSDS